MMAVDGTLLDGVLSIVADPQDWVIVAAER